MWTPYIWLFCLVLICTLGHLVQEWAKKLPDDKKISWRGFPVQVAMDAVAWLLFSVAGIGFIAFVVVVLIGYK